MFAETTDDKRLGQSILDDLLIVVLAFISVILLVFQELGTHTPEQAQVLARADQAIALVFLFDFCIRLIRATDRGKFLRHHWWELLASIPITSEPTQALRGLRLLRVIRLLRLLRIVRFFARLKEVLEHSQKFADQARTFYLASIACTVLLGGALGFHYMESDVNPNIHSLWDSFWWTVVTVTTVGYADIYPVTNGGRVLAILLILTGIATFGTITAAIAAYILSKKD